MGYRIKQAVISSFPGIAAMWGIAHSPPRDHAAAMRIRIFFSGAAIIGLGVLAGRLLEKKAADEFLLGTLTLGGGLIICGLFTLKMRWHGVIGAGVLALLGAGRGIGNLPDLAALFIGDRERGPAPALEFGVTAVCLTLLLAVLTELFRERTRRMLEEK
jgi:hypothetical protein